MATAARITSML